ncbi:MAG: putative sugar nucleotidyl transferase [Planctomycetota bacterium]
MNILLFEDSGVEKLFPITTGRPAYAIHCAGFRLIDRLKAMNRPIVSWVRPYLESIQLQDFDFLASELNPEHDETLILNSRLAPTKANLNAIQRMVESTSDRGFVQRSDWAVAAAKIRTADILNQPNLKQQDWIEGLVNQPKIEVLESELSIFQYPHDVVAINMSSFQENIEAKIRLGVFSEIKVGVFVGSDVQISQSAHFDSEDGPIVIESGTRIGPFTFFRGPVFIGANCKVSEHASIKDAVSISHTCKIGGEIESTVFEAWSNKQHHGFLGHSYVGSWVNLGAGTCNSDLKNTYGKVNMVYGNGKIPTKMQFMGCAVGDYAKTAINTSIFTGKTIGTAAMVYGFATTNVPSFTNYARTFDKMGELPPEIVEITQKRMFQRRKVEQRPCDIQLLRDMYRVTAGERPAGLSREPISL